MDSQSILRLSKEKRKELLKSLDFRRQLFQNDHYLFVYLVQGLKGEELFYLLDENIIPLLVCDVRVADKLNAIITCGNSYNNLFLSDKRILELIFLHIDKLDIYLYSLNENFGNSYFNYILEKNLDISYLEYLSSEVQVKLIKDKNNYEKLVANKNNLSLLMHLGKEAIEYLLLQSYFENVFLNYSVNDIYYIINKGVVLPTHIQISNVLINKYLEIEDINMYNDYFTRLGDNIFLKDKLREKRKKLYIEKVRSIDKELQMFLSYKDILNSNGIGAVSDTKMRINLSSIGNDKEKKKKFLQENTLTKLLEMGIDASFEDLTYNVLENIKIILGFLSQVNVKIIPDSRLYIYQKIYNYYNLSFDEKISLFYELMSIEDNASLFYDDFKACFNYSLKLLKDSIFEIDNSSLENVDGSLVYKLEGQKFKMLINHTYLDRNSALKGNVWYDNRDYASLSLIGDSFLGTFRDPDDNVILGFTEFDTDYIAHVYRSDSFSAKKAGSKRILNIYTPDNLLLNSQGYNEILMKENGLKPSYVVCYDTIKIGDIATSKALGGIPLVVIDTKKYNVKNSVPLVHGEKYFSGGEVYDIRDYRGVIHR